MNFSVEQLCELLGFQLSDEQIDAVTADLTAPLLVVAGAGSGKTSVMAARVVWAVAAGQMDPGQILGLTFTSKAAGEFGSRVRSLLARFSGSPVGATHLSGPGSALSEESGEPSISTYHSFAHQLVAEHGLRIGIEPGARLLADNETAHLVYDELANTERTLTDQASSMQSVVSAVVSLDQQLAEHAVSPRALRDFDASVIAAVDGLDKTVLKDREMRAVAARRQQLSWLVDDVRARKAALGVVDFADLLRFGHQLAARNDVQQVVRERFPLVLLDEYQDTSVVQTELLSSLFGVGHAVTAVGDPLQAIYGWRGASTGAMEQFPQLFGDAEQPAAVCELSISQRSGPRVLAVANELANPLRDECAVVTLRPGQQADGSFKRDAVRASLHETYDQELDWVADRVAEQVAAGVPGDDIAILCRVASDFGPMVRALAQRGVAAAVSSSEGVLASPEVSHVLNVLSVIDDVNANPAMLEILVGPRMRIGPRDLALLGARAAQLARESAVDESRASMTVDLRSGLGRGDRLDLASLVEAVFDPGSAQDYPYSPQARERLAQLCQQLDYLSRFRTADLPELVARVIASIGLDVEVRLAALTTHAEPLGLKPGSSASHGIAAVNAFVELVHRYCAGETSGSLAGFLSWVRMIEDFGGDPSLDVPAPAGSVTLLTVHKAKGLEWDVVAVPFLSAGVFPTSRARSRWTSSVGEIPHRLRGDRERLVDLRGHGTAGHREFAEGMTTHAEAEERRLAYVATTRPTRLLLISGHWWGPNQKKVRGPSPYLLAAHDSLTDSSPQDPWVSRTSHEANPALQSAPTYHWPPGVDPDAQQRRCSGAQLVSSPAAEMPLAQLSDAEREIVAAWDSDIEALLAQRHVRNSRTIGRPEHLPSTMSASEVMAAAANREAFLANRERPVPRRPSAAARQGTTFHSWVEERFGQRALFDELPGAFDQDLFSDPELAELKEGFLATKYADLIPHAVEVPFAIVLAGRVIKGRIDAVYEVDGRWEVVDWKTNRRASADPLQLAIYREAWSHIAGAPVSDIDAAFVYVRSGHVHAINDLPDPLAVLTEPVD